MVLWCSEARRIIVVVTSPQWHVLPAWVPWPSDKFQPVTTTEAETPPERNHSILPMLYKDKDKIFVGVKAPTVVHDRLGALSIWSPIVTAYLFILTFFVRSRSRHPPLHFSLILYLHVSFMDAHYWFQPMLHVSLNHLSNFTSLPSIGSNQYYYWLSVSLFNKHVLIR